MLSTFRHVGTKTPEKVLNLSCPPTGRGPSPGFVFLSGESFVPSAPCTSPVGATEARDARRALGRFSGSRGVVSCASISSFPRFDILRINELCHGAATAAPVEVSSWVFLPSVGKMEFRLSSSWAMSPAVRVWKVGRNVEEAVEPGFVECALPEPSLRFDMMPLLDVLEAVQGVL